jgi:hypothetical protein
MKGARSKKPVARILLIVTAVLLAVAPTPPRWVERFYSNGIYPPLERFLTTQSNRVSFAAADVLAVIAVAAALVWSIRTFRSAGRRRIVALGVLLFDAAAAAALVYILFLALWGLNYRRVPLTRKLDYDSSRVTAGAARAMLTRTIEALNADSPAVHSGAWPAEDELREALAQSLRAAAAETGSRVPIVTGRPKVSIVDRYLGATGIDGFTNPFGLEIVLNSELLPAERPFVIAHEWSHLAGFADESEAGFVGLIACLRSDRAVLRYSGWLALCQFLAERVAVETPRLLPPVVADLRAIVERVRRRYRPTLGQAQERVYDRFLKANRVEEGVASYGLMVRLVLGTRVIP